jgi:murein DD-endopeptidase MepM/ murein hydrolase activator NlpD
MTWAGAASRGVLCTVLSMVLALTAGSAAVSAWARGSGEHGRSAIGSEPVTSKLSATPAHSAPSAPSARASRESVWPVEGGDGAVRPMVTRGWEPPPSPWAAGHRGVDLGASEGRAVRTAGDGRVSFAGQVAGRGVVSVELSGTGRPPIRITYEPVRPSVRKGERVRAGETVAHVRGGPSHCRASCLHWGAKRDARYLDPLSLLSASLLRGGASRLLPVFGIPVPRGHGGSGLRSSGRAAKAPGPDISAKPSRAPP